MAGASIDSDGTAYFAFNAQVNGAPYYREFDGTIDSSGSFVGTTHSGEAATGTVSRDAGSVNATIVWQKRTAAGNVFFTETENFNLIQQE